MQSGSLARVLVITCLTAVMADPALAQCRRVWRLDLPALMPIDGAIYDTAVWDDGRGPALYAVGFFALQDGSAWADGVARWNGTRWEPFGGGVGYTTHTGYPEVHAVTVFNGELVIAGDFTRVGNVPANNIARWSGTGWAPLGDGFHEIIYALGIYDGKLIAGGRAWDGSRWTALGSLAGQVPTPFAITVFQGDLIVGGDGGPYLARFDGTSWSTLGGAVGGIVEALTVYNGELIAGGSFWTAGGATVPNIARWNGSRWAPLSAAGEVNDQVKAFAEFDGALIVGGHFTAAGGQLAGKVARWNADGSGAWSSMTTGVPFFGWDDGVFDFSIHEAELVAAGAFPGLPDNPVRLNWARWSCTEVPDATPIAHIGGTRARLDRGVGQRPGRREYARAGGCHHGELHDRPVVRMGPHQLHPAAEGSGAPRRDDRAEEPGVIDRAERVQHARECGEPAAADGHAVEQDPTASHHA